MGVTENCQTKTMNTVVSLVNNITQSYINIPADVIPVEHPVRISAVLYAILVIGGYLTYGIFATLSYFVLYRWKPDLLAEGDDRISVEQVKEEIKLSCTSIP